MHFKLIKCVFLFGPPCMVFEHRESHLCKLNLVFGQS